MTNHVQLDTLLRAKSSMVLETELKRRVIGQDAAIDKVVSTLERQRTGLYKTRRPLGTMLFLGPTGVGKTRVAEALAEVLFGNPDALIKIDCAEFQESQSVLKFTGSAPGYIGYTEKEEGMFISQAKLDAHKTEENPISILVLDEVEKAHDNLFRLFLSILDKGVISLNNGKKIDFTKTIIIMTSNLGAQDVARYVDGSLGFRSGPRTEEKVHASITNKALKLKFTPEFLNRIDQIVHFHHLTADHVAQILDIECKSIQKRIFTSDTLHPFSFSLDAKAREHILSKGYNQEYGARELNRVLEQELVSGLASLILTGQIEVGDELYVSQYDSKLTFKKSDSVEVQDEELLAEFST